MMLESLYNTTHVMSAIATTCVQLERRHANVTTPRTHIFTSANCALLGYVFKTSERACGYHAVTSSEAPRFLNLEAFIPAPEVTPPAELDN